MALKFAEGDCGMVVSGPSYENSRLGEMFSAYHVVTNENDFWYEFNKEPSFTNYWITDNYLTGNDTTLSMFFACPTTIYGFYIKNTHNAEGNDRGTKDFKIFSSDSEDGLWTEIISGSLPDARNETDVPTQSFTLNSSVTTQYIRFQIESYYGLGGGLQYLAAYY